MNKKGQVLVSFLIIIPLIIVLVGAMIESVYLSYQKRKFYSVTKTIIASCLERNEKDDIINLYNDNSIDIKDIDIIYDNGLTIKASTEVDSLLGKIISKDKYLINVNINGKKENDKIVYQRG